LKVKTITGRKAWWYSPKSTTKNVATAAALAADIVPFSMMQYQNQSVLNYGKNNNSITKRTRLDAPEKSSYG
jgi:hypothetical protein